MLERGRELSNQKGSLDPLLLCDDLCAWDVREGESIFFDWINLIRNPDGQIPYWRNMCCKESIQKHMNNTADCNSVPWFMAGGHFQFRLQNPPSNCKEPYQNYSYFLEVEIVPSLTVWLFPSEVKMEFEWNHILPFHMCQLTFPSDPKFEIKDGTLNDIIFCLPFQMQLILFLLSHYF